MLSAKDRVIKAVIQMQKTKPFFAYILMNFDAHEVEKDSQIQTFAVDKYGTLYFHPDFTQKQSDDQLKYILCHEALHIAKGDFFRIKNRNPMIWNIASDCIINDYCNREKYTPPTDGFIPNKDGDVVIAGKTYNIRDKTSEQVYDMIYDDFPKIKIMISGKDGGDGKNEGHGGFDVHIMDDSGDKGNSNGKGSDEGSNIPGETSAGIAAAEAKWKKITVEAATVARSRGILPGFAEELIEGLLNPQIDWKSRLRSLITNDIPVDFHNRSPGRSFYGTGVWVPQILRENIHLMISVDCSGSTRGDRESFVSECLGILSAHPQIRGRLVAWDTHVNPDNDIEVSSDSLEQFNKMKLKDISGGTELSSYTDHCEKMGYTARTHIILTDGMIESEPKCPAGKCLFVLCKNGTDEIVKNYGEVVWMRE